METKCRGIRGATTVTANTREAILDATEDLLAELVRANHVQLDDIAAVIFSTTPDLNAEFPALAARKLGWTALALLCGHEIDVPGALPMCLRVLMLVNTSKAPGELVHVYLRDARTLRPDIANNNSN